MILLTGASGFLGRHFLETMTPVSEPVLAVDVRPPDRIVHPKIPVEYTQVDLFDYKAVSTLFNSYRPHRIVHLAALSTVGDKNAVRVNVGMTTNILTAAIKIPDNSNKPKIILIGSAAEYGNINSDRIAPDEQSKLDPQEPYAESKALCAQLATRYRRDFGLPISIIRFANIYGPKQEPGRLLPNLIKNSVEGTPLRLNAYGSPTRQWIYVDDACGAIRRVLEDLDDGLGHIFNVANPQEISLIALARIVAAQTQDQLLARGKIPIPVSFDIKSTAGGAQRVAMDVTYIKQTLRWTPTTDIDEGVRRTVSSYLEDFDEDHSAVDSRRLVTRA